MGRLAFGRLACTRQLRHELGDAGRQHVHLGCEGVHLVEEHPGELGVVGVEAPGQGLNQLGVLGLHTAPRQLGEHLWVALAGDEGFYHVPPRAAQDVARYAGELDQGVLEQLLQALGVAGALGDEVVAEARVVPELAHLLARHEAGPEHPPLVQLAEPDRVQLVRFWASGHVFHVPGVDEPHGEAPARALFSCLRCVRSRIWGLLCVVEPLFTGFLSF